MFVIMKEDLEGFDQVLIWFGSGEEGNQRRRKLEKNMKKEKLEKIWKRQKDVGEDLKEKLIPHTEEFKKSN